MRIRQDRAGVALVMVVVVVAMLVVVAVPFAMSMRLAYRGSATYVDQVEARFAARGAVRHATGRLMRTHDSREATGLDKDYNTPDFDGRYEITDAVERRGIGAGRRVLWSAKVEDEQGKVDLNTASPWVLGNLLASCTVTEGVDEGQTEIPVDSGTAGYFDPRGGYLWHARELIRYKTFDGSVFGGCERGIAADAPEYGDAAKIPEGALVIDARAYWLAQLGIVGGEASGRLFYLRTVAELAQLAEVTFSLGPSYPPMSASLAPHELERLDPHVTVHAHRPSGEGMVAEQWILSDIPLPAEDDTNPTRVECFHPEDYPVGTTVRIASSAGAEFALVAANAVNPKSPRGFVILNKQLRREYIAQAATIALLEPHAVNLNTASYKVLVALLAGLGRVDQRVWANQQAGGGPITKAEADLMARAVVLWRAEKGAVRNEADLIACWSALGDDLSARKIGTAIANLAYGGMGLGVRTQPAVFASGNVFAIEGAGIVQGPTGHEVARAVVRETVEVAPPMASEHRVRGQVGFERAMRRYRAVGAETFPTWVRSGPQRDIGFGYLAATNELAPGQVLDPDEVGDLRLRHVPVMLQQISGGTQAVEHFDGTREGLATNGPVAFPLLGKTPQLDPNTGHIECGAVAFWMRYDGGDGLRHYLADYGQAEWANRISLYVDTQSDELVAELADASLERVKAQVRVAWRPKTGVWYHLAVVWKSTNDGQLGLLVDGRPVGSFTYRDDQGLDRATRLTGGLTAGDGTIGVASTEGFPDEGSLRIGAEIIEYQSKSKTAFTVRTSWPGFSGAAEGRGARGSVAADHPQDARVVPWGFKGGFNGLDVFVGGAILVEDLAADAWTRVEIINDPVPANPAPFPPKFFLDTHTSVEVSSTVGFASKGYVVFGSPGQNGNWRVEIAYHDGKTGNSLTGLIRGQLGTTALDFPNLATFVIPISIHVSQHTEYAATNQWIAIDDEWIQATDKATQGTESFFVFRGRFRQILTDLLLTGQLDHPQRSVGGTNTAAHVAGAKVLPVFVFTGVQAGAILAHPLARRDQVTLINRNQNAERELRTVRWHSHTNGPNGDPAGGVCRVSFDDFTQRRYDASNGLTRLLKFPAGELPNEVYPFHLGGKSPGSEQAGGQVTAVIDELFGETYGQPGFFFATAQVAPGADTITVTGIASLPAFGVVKLGDELIGFASQNPTQNGEGELLGCTRGLFGTTATAHDAGTPVFNASHYLRAVLFPADVAEDAAAISATGANRLPDYGAILAGTEVIGFTSRTGGAIEMPVDRLGKGALRGRYGTRAEGHAEGTLAVWQPIRYPDGYALNVDSPELVRVEDRFSSRTTAFAGLAWEVESPSDALEVHVLARLDGTGAWSDEPLVDQAAPPPGRVLLFTDPDKLGSLGPQVADRIELRFLFYYGKGAFKSDAWKATPILKSYTVRYASGPDSLSREAGR